MVYKWIYSIVHMYMHGCVHGVCIYMSRFREGLYDNVNRNKLEGWR